MNHTTPREADDIPVLRAHQLEATKRRVLAKLRSMGVAKTTVAFKAEPNGTYSVEATETDAEDGHGKRLSMKRQLEHSFIEAETLLERFSLDVVAHLFGLFDDEGGNGHVSINVKTGAILIEHTRFETNQISTEKTF